MTGLPRPRLVIALVLLVLGTVLLVLDVAGLYLDPPTSAPSVAAKQIPGFHFATRSNDELLRRLSSADAEFSLSAVNELVSASIRHVEDRKLTVYENPLMWVAGKFYEPLSRTQDPYKIARGREGLCSESARVLNEIARLHGVPARFIGLNGHVVSEVQTPQGWRVADPDFGVEYPMPLRELESEAGPDAMTRALREKGYDQQTIAQYIAVVRSTSDNVVAPIHAPLSPRLALIEASTEWLKWILPGAFIGAGVLLLRKRKVAPLVPE